MPVPLAITNRVPGCSLGARIVSTEGGQSTQITLMSLEPGPLPEHTFDAPAGYNQMQMPSIPGLLGGLPGK